MVDFLPVLMRQRGRIREIVEVLARYGFADLANHFAHAQASSGEVLSRRFLVSRVDAKLAALSTGQRVRGALGEMGPTWVKFGQMLSVRADLVGAEVAEELTRLQNAVPPDSAGYAEALIAAELGRPVEQIFAEFGTVPIASGSVAQVHRATTWEGEEVAVKVLHRNVERRVTSDLELMLALAEFVETVDPELARIEPGQLVGQFEVMMRAAIDLTHEAQNLTQFRANFAEEPDIVIPAPFPRLSAQRVLTMDFVTGQPIDDTAGIARSGWTVAGLVRRVSKVYLDMVFRDGVYHADPHPGNLLVGRDALIIVDFGDTSTLTTTSRNHLQLLLKAVASRDLDDLTEAIMDITAAPKTTDRVALTNDVSRLMGPYLQEDTTALDIAAFIATVLHVAHRNNLRLPPDLAVGFRVLALLQGLSLRLGAEVDFVKLIRPYIVDMARIRLDPRGRTRPVMRDLRALDALLTGLPEDVSDLLDRLRDGNLDMDIKLHDTDDRVAQLVDGLLVAALTIGAADLVARDAKPTIASVSVPGALTAALGAVTYQRLRRRRPNYLNLSTRAARIAKFVMASRRAR